MGLEWLLGSGDNKTTKTETYTANPYATGALTYADTLAKGLPGAGAVPMQGTAGFSPEQEAAFQKIWGAQGLYNPYAARAEALNAEYGKGLDAGRVQDMYQQLSAGPLAQLRDQQGAQMAAATRGAVGASGGTGASRIGVAQANLANQQNLATGQIQSSLLDRAIQSELAAQANRGSAAVQEANLGMGFTGQNYNDISNLYGAGAARQGLSQQQLNALYAQQQGQYQNPYSNFAAYSSLLPQYSNIYKGNTTTETTVPQQGLLQTFTGALGAGLGSYIGSGGNPISAGMSALKQMGQPAPGTASNNAIYGSGGRVNGYAPGGGVGMGSYPGSYPQQPSGFAPQANFGQANFGGWNNPSGTNTGMVPNAGSMGFNGFNGFRGYNNPGYAAMMRARQQGQQPATGGLFGRMVNQYFPQQQQDALAKAPDASPFSQALGSLQGQPGQSAFGQQQAALGQQQAGMAPFGQTTPIPPYQPKNPFEVEGPENPVPPAGIAPSLAAPAPLPDSSAGGFMQGPAPSLSPTNTANTAGTFGGGIVAPQQNAFGIPRTLARGGVVNGYEDGGDVFDERFRASEDDNGIKYVSPFDVETKNAFLDTARESPTRSVSMYDVPSASIPIPRSRPAEASDSLRPVSEDERPGPLRLTPSGVDEEIYRSRATPMVSTDLPNTAFKAPERNPWAPHIAAFAAGASAMNERLPSGHLANSGFGGIGNAMAKGLLAGQGVERANRDEDRKNYDLQLQGEALKNKAIMERMPYEQMTAAQEEQANQAARPYKETTVAERHRNELAWAQFNRPYNELKKEDRERIDIENRRLDLEERKFDRPYQDMTAKEKAEMDRGLWQYIGPTPDGKGSVYQNARAPNDAPIVRRVNEPVGSKGPPRNINSALEDKLGKQASAYEQSATAANTFRDEYSGYQIKQIGNINNWIGRNLKSADPRKVEMAKWWQNYQAYKAAVRNGLYGSALTKYEIDEWENQDISPGMQPDVLMANLERQNRIIKNGLLRHGHSLVSQGVPRTAVENLYGFDIGDSAPRTQAIQPRISKQEREKALKWLENNKDDPRASAVRRKLGI